MGPATTACVEAGQTTENKADPANIGIRAASFIDLHRNCGRTPVPRRLTSRTPQMLGWRLETTALPPIRLAFATVAHDLYVGSSIARRLWLSRELPRAFGYYCGSVAIQGHCCSRYRRSRSYANRRYDECRWPFHSLILVGGLAG